MRPEPSHKTTYVSLNPVKLSAPIIRVSEKANKWLDAMVDIHETEVGVLGVVEELGNNTYLIKDIFYPKHSEAHGATCEISPEGESLMAEWLINKGREEDVAKVRFWGHSHVNMGVSPSGQDETQSIERMMRTQAYFIRGIFNKSGLMSISFYDFQNQRRFDHIDWSIDGDEDDSIKAKIRELKVVNIPAAGVHHYTPPVHQGAYNSHFFRNNGYNNFDDNMDAFGVPLLPEKQHSYTSQATSKLGRGDQFRKNGRRKHSYSHEFVKL